MALISKTVLQFTDAIENGTVTDVLAALKKPGADRIVMVVRLRYNLGDTPQFPSSLEVWDVG